jgi:transcriptional regulator MraZ
MPWWPRPVDPLIIPCYPKSSHGAAQPSPSPGWASQPSRRRYVRGVGLGGEGVDRFVSRFTNRLDAKGRVSIPAPFRAVLARDGFEGLFVHPSLDATAVDCGGNALVREIDQLLALHAPYSEDHEFLATALYGASEILKVDAEGRVVLTDSIKAYAGISEEVTFVGQGDKFQIWEPGRFRAHFEEARNRVRDLRRELNSRTAGEPRPHGARE